MKHKDGKWIWILDRGKVMTKTKDGKPEWMYGTHLDITENRHYDELIKKQLAEKDILLREVHHRLKNNINLIETFLSSQSASTENPEAKSILQNIFTRVQSMRVLYDKLLFSNDYHDISIKDYTESLIDSLQSILGPDRNINVVKHISEFNVSSKEVFFIGMIINELISNAYKYAFNETDSGIISIVIDKTGGIVSLIIQDDGAGISENKQFSGPGLAIAKLLVEQLNGSFNITSDHGTRVCIEFEL